MTFLANSVVAEEVGVVAPGYGTLGGGERLTAIDLAPTPAAGPIEALLSQFAPISLEATNQSARMLKRTDNKYVLNIDQLATVFGDLSDDFRGLEIEGKRIFTYNSCYFDDNYKCYHDHHQGKRQRFKVRTRHYVDSDQLYFEVKLKGKRGKTSKYRMPCDEFLVPELTNDRLALLKDCYRELYHKEFPHHLSPALIIKYQRLTLVSVHGGERVTVDFDLGFESIDGRSAHINGDFIIVETKSENGRGLADRALKKNHIRTLSGCSKYCIGTVLTGNVEKHNNFRHVFKHLRDKLIGADSQMIANIAARGQ